MKNNNDVAKLWIEKADKDLEVAALLLKKKDKYLDFACFHCQQSFEKYLKSLIAKRGKMPEKTHDLSKLLNEVAKFHFGLIKHVDTAKDLNQYAVIPRYPSAIFDVTASTLKRLIKKTNELGDLVKEIVGL